MTKIAIVGEAWGETEAQWKRPFVGAAGDELNRMLQDAGLLREECFLTNVFNLHPDRNDITTLCSSKTEGDYIPGLPALTKGKYVRREYKAELDRLYSELEQVRPNVVLALGNTACWALLRQTAISKLRGAVALSPVVEGLKVIPTYHPAAILRQYDLRPVTVLDIMKAKRESAFPEVRRVSREIWLDPTIADIERFYHEHVLSSKRMAVDIETAAGQITCVGFAPSPDRCLVIPFWDYRNADGSYWRSFEEELLAWDWVQRLCATDVPKVGQNGLYDLYYLWTVYGIPILNYDDDTMLLHHSLQPESPKGLDFLGSVYTNEPAWKTHRPKGKHTIKREE